MEMYEPAYPPSPLLARAAPSERVYLSTTIPYVNGPPHLGHALEPLALSFDFIRTSSDPRHRPGVQQLWQACLASGDLYQKDYSGLYCVGCEQFYKPAELPGGWCPEHGTRPQEVTERNWFFRLSRYAGQLIDLISSGQLRTEPAARRN